MGQAKKVITSINVEIIGDINLTGNDTPNGKPLKIGVKEMCTIYYADGTREVIETENLSESILLFINSIYEVEVTAKAFVQEDIKKALKE